MFTGGDHLTLYRAAGGGQFDIVTLDAPETSQTATTTLADDGRTLTEQGAELTTTFTVEGDEMVIASVFTAGGDQTYACRRGADAEGDAAVAERRGSAGAGAPSA